MRAGLPARTPHNEKGRVATRPFLGLAPGGGSLPGAGWRAGYSFSRGVYFIGTPVDEGAGFPSIVWSSMISTRVPSML